MWIVDVWDVCILLCNYDVYDRLLFRKHVKTNPGGLLYAHSNEITEITTNISP